MHAVRLIAVVVAFAVSGCSSWATIQRTVPRETPIPVTGYTVVYVEAGAGETRDRIADAVQAQLENAGIHVVRVVSAAGELAAGSAILTVDFEELDRGVETFAPSAVGRTGTGLAYSGRVVAGIRLTLRDAGGHALGDVQVTDEAVALAQPPPLPSQSQGSVPVFYQQGPPAYDDPTAMDIEALVRRLIEAALATMVDRTGVDDLELDGDGAAHAAVELAVAGSVHDARIMLEQLASQSTGLPGERARLLYDLGQLRRLDVDGAAADPIEEERARLASAEEALVAASALLEDTHTTRALAQLRSERVAREQARAAIARRAAPVP